MLSATACGREKHQMEKVGHGVVAVNQGGGKVFRAGAYWGLTRESSAFNIYCTSGDTKLVKPNDKPITKTTCYTDNTADLTEDNSYFIRSLVSDEEGPISKPFLNKIGVNFRRNDKN